MKKAAFFIAISMIGFTGCKKDVIEQEATTPSPVASIPFTGTWERQFNAGPGNPHTATYKIYQDSIRYTLTGAVGTANYVIHKDNYLTLNNRFVGHTPDNQYYLIFVKEHPGDSITLYKQTVANATEGLNISVPADTTTQNHGWNTYYLQ